MTIRPVNWPKYEGPMTLKSMKHERKLRMCREWHRQWRNAERKYRRWAVYTIL